MYCGHYVSYVSDSSTGIWWHCDDDNITEISDLPNGFYYRETHEPMKKKNKLMHGSTDVLFVVYIRTIHLTKHSYIFLKNLKSCPKVLSRRK